MKKLFNIFLLCLLAATTALAQNTNTHTLRLKVKPDRAFSVTLLCYETAESNWSGFISPQIARVESGKNALTIDLEAQVPAGGGVRIQVTSTTSPYEPFQYRLVSWKANGEEVELTNRPGNNYFNAYWVMPDEDVELVGLFEYDPTGTPGSGTQPSAGGWYPETGTLVCDNNGQLPQGFTVSTDGKLVQTLIIGGNNYGGTDGITFNATQYPNCTTWDISRTNANRAKAMNSALKTVIMPATITGLLSNAFKGTALETLVLYATTPPSMDNSTFANSPDMVVRVPAESVPLYQANVYWKKFTIVPMDTEYANLKVLLMETPEAATLAKYKNMSLVLTNSTSGQTRRFLVNGLLNDYVFRYLTTNTAYKVQLLNDRDMAVATLDNIYLGEDSKTVTLPTLRGAHTLQLVLTENGNPVGEGLFSNIWTDGDGNYIARGTSLYGVLDGEQLIYSISLDHSLAMQYAVPAKDTIVVGRQEDVIILPLKPIEEKEVAFLVVDSLTHQGIKDAVITVAQLFGQGERGTTVTLTTGADGRASGRLLAVPSAITVNSPMHGSQSMAVDLADTPSMTIAFLPANGTTIQLSHTYQPAVAEGQTPTVQNSYDDGRSLNYTFTATLPDGRDSIITQYLTNYPLYALYTSLPAGTKVRVEAVSATGIIEPVTAETIVEEGKNVRVVLPIVQRGYIEASYYRTESSKPAILVFNAETGELVKRQTFFDTSIKTISITDLPVGEYLVAAMSQGVQYASISSRSQLELYEADKDYVAQTVSVSDGHIATAHFTRVPLATTQLETNLSERRAHWGTSSVTLGYNAGITVQVAFEGLQERMYGTHYDESLYPTDCRLEVYLPEGIAQPTVYRSYRQYHNNIPGSILMTAATTQWNEAECKLTVDWPHIDEGGKVNIATVPTKVGSYKPGIYLCYTLGGKPYREMLESNELAVSRSDITVPELVITPTFKVRGKAMYIEEETTQPAGSRMNAAGATAGSSYYGGMHNTGRYEFYEVTVMDGDDEIGKAKINADGEWSARCTLARATTLSKHNIWAKIAYKNGVSYQTEAKPLTYDPNGVVANTVKMSFFNHHPVHLDNREVLFDLQTQEATPRSYGFDSQEGVNTDFTFEINLSNNDTTKVYAVDLAIFTEGPDAESFIIPAHYNARKNRWIAYWKFNTRSLPSNVNVRAYYHGDPIGSRNELQEVIDNYEAWFEKNKAAETLLLSLEQMIKQLDDAVANNDVSLIPDFGQLTNTIGEINKSLGFEPYQDTAPTTDISADSLQAILDDIAQYAGLGTDFGNITPVNELGNSLEGVEFGHATGLSKESLTADGYDMMQLDDGSVVFVKADEDGSFTFVDLKADLVMKCNGKTTEARAVAPLRGMKDTIEELYDTYSEAIDKLKGYLDDCSALCDKGIDILSHWIIQNNKHIEELEKSMEFIRKDKYLDPVNKAKILSVRSTAIKDVQKNTSRIQQVQNGLKRFKYAKFIGCLSSLWSLVDDFISAKSFISRLIQIRKGLPQPCPDDQAKRDGLYSELTSAIRASLVFQISLITNDILAVGEAVAGLATLGASGGTSALPSGLAIAASLVQMGLSMLGKHMYDSNTEGMTHEYAYQKSQLKCHRDKKKEDEKKCNKDCGGGGGDGGDGGDGGGGGMGGGTGGTKGVMDPSGFVYEGVEDNRLEGVTTTVFYKETTKDMFGEDQEKVYVWDAEFYGQVNPQITDANGEYGWMVPAGLWQVKYEKQGYQTEYSDWLPVPPPQLEVNQPMTQISEPVVSDVKATPQAVVVTFDKYMRADSLTDSRLFVTQGGKKVSGTIDLMLPADPAQAMQRLTNRVRFVPATQLPAGQKLTLTVKGNVLSYAGVEMGSDFQQEFTIKTDVERIVVDIPSTSDGNPAVNVLYDQGTPLAIQALPAEAAAGKTVKARILSDMIATANATEMTLDSQGKANLTITGEAHGTTALLLEMADDPQVKQVVVVTVKEEGDFVCPTPKSNYLPDQAYPEGTQIELTCSLDGATIWYTTDGSCPCNSSTARKYETPITLNGDMLIKAIATAPGWADSDIAELTFRLYDPDGIRVVDAGRMAKNNITYTLSGVKVGKTKRLPRGLYIRNGKKFVVK